MTKLPSRDGKGTNISEWTGQEMEPVGSLQGLLHCGELSSVDNVHTCILHVRIMDMCVYTHVYT